jgi:hypothetical protein
MGLLSADFPFAAWDRSPEALTGTPYATPSPPMRRFVLSLALACAATVQSAEPLVKNTDPVFLFNGRDLTGLHIFTESPETDPATAWKIEDGLLRCIGRGRGYVRTTAAYADYRLMVEWRWPARPGNSGVMVNLTGPDGIWPKSIECQLANGHAGDFATFSDARSKEEIVSRNPAGVSTGRLNRNAAAGQVEKPAGEWNRYDIIVSGDTITVFVNGVRVNQMSGVTPSGGLIAFQAEGAAIDFRNIELTPLPAAKDLNAPMPK